MAKEQKPLSRTRAIGVGQRMSSGFEEAVGDSKGALTPETRLLVGIRGAVNELRPDTTAAWMAATLTQALAELGVTEDPELHLPSKRGAK